jgi:hypothetical protein
MQASRPADVGAYPGQWVGGSSFLYPAEDTGCWYHIHVRMGRNMRVFCSLSYVGSNSWITMGGPNHYCPWGNTNGCQFWGYIKNSDWHWAARSVALTNNDYIDSPGGWILAVDNP